jgi:hypothetical protein
MEEKKRRNQLERGGLELEGKEFRDDDDALRFQQSDVWFGLVLVFSRDIQLVLITLFHSFDTISSSFLCTLISVQSNIFF